MSHRKYVINDPEGFAPLLYIDLIISIFHRIRHLLGGRDGGREGGRGI